MEPGPVWRAPWRLPASNPNGTRVLPPPRRGAWKHAFPHRGPPRVRLPLVPLPQCARTCCPQHQGTAFQEGAAGGPERRTPMLAQRPFCALDKGWRGWNHGMGRGQAHTLSPKTKGPQCPWANRHVPLGHTAKTEHSRRALLTAHMQESKCFGWPPPSVRPG